MYRRAQLFPVSRASSSAQIQAAKITAALFNVCIKRLQHKKCGSYMASPKKSAIQAIIHRTAEAKQVQCLSTVISGQAAQRPAENDTSQMCKHPEIQWQKLSQ